MPLKRYYNKKALTAEVLTLIEPLRSRFELPTSPTRMGYYTYYREELDGIKTLYQTDDLQVYVDMQARKVHFKIHAYYSSLGLKRIRRMQKTLRKHVDEVLAHARKRAVEATDASDMLKSMTMARNAKRTDLELTIERAKSRLASITNDSYVERFDLLRKKLPEGYRWLDKSILPKLPHLPQQSNKPEWMQWVLRAVLYAAPITKFPNGYEGKEEPWHKVTLGPWAVLIWWCRERERYEFTLQVMNERVATAFGVSPHPHCPYNSETMCWGRSKELIAAQSGDIASLLMNFRVWADSFNYGPHIGNQAYNDLWNFWSGDPKHHCSKDYPLGECKGHKEPRRRCWFCGKCSTKCWHCLCIGGERSHRPCPAKKCKIITCQHAVKTLACLHQHSDALKWQHQVWSGRAMETHNCTNVCRHCNKCSSHCRCIYVKYKTEGGKERYRKFTPKHNPKRKWRKGNA